MIVLTFCAGLLLGALVGAYAALVISRRRIEAAAEMALKALVLERETRKRKKRRGRLTRAKRGSNRHERNRRPIRDEERPPRPPPRPAAEPDLLWPRPVASPPETTHGQ